MVQTTVIDNANHPLGEILNRELLIANEFHAASAFFNSGGLDIIKPGIERILENNGSVHIVHGADFRITDSMAIQGLVELKTRYQNMSYFVHCDWWMATRHSFHPKLYIATPDHQKYCAIIGSSNLTRGGMSENIEVNTVIRGNLSEKSVSQCLDIFQSIYDSVPLLQPDMSFVESYDRLRQSADRLSPRQDPPPELADEYQKLVALQSDAKGGWSPNTQTEFVIKAMENLAGGDFTQYFTLENIYNETERLARNAGQQYKWDTFRNSVRGRLNDDTLGKGKRDLFERLGGVSGRYGQYRLSDEGMNYGKRKSGSFSQ